jgi:hypothetical protein
VDDMSIQAAGRQTTGIASTGYYDPDSIEDANVESKKSPVAETPAKSEYREEIVDIFLSNYGESAAENDYKITKNTPQGKLTVVMDNYGKQLQNNYHIKADTPKGNIDFKILNTGDNLYENNLEINGHDLLGDINLLVDNRGQSKYENDYKITGSVYGKKVDIFIDNSGKSNAENDFSVKGTVPPGFLSSPLFSGIIMPSIASIPVLNQAAIRDSGHVSQSVVGPIMLNYCLSVLNAVEKEMETVK